MGSQEQQQGTLYIVSTPIGNARDITLRAIDTLSEKVDIILCEDTRQTLKLLSSCGIKTKARLISFFAASEKAKTFSVVKTLLDGKNVALVSSRGTPAISDPGFFLIKNAIAAGIRVEPVPGTSAVISALVCSGFPTDDFIFIGFLKRKRGKLKQQILSALSSGIRTLVFFESAARIRTTLDIFRDIFQDKGQTVHISIAREMTKFYEEFIRGTLDEVIRKLQSKEELKGEMTAVLYIEEAADNTSASLLRN